MNYNYPEGATPLDHDELLDLIPTHITTQDQLNAWEQKNIVLAQMWAQKKKNIISIEFIKKLHNHMFNETWKWAGEFRKSEKNIGVNSYKISVELKKLCDDVTYQLQHATFTDDEIAVRLHHRLVFIHPFSNGNGRHARLMADLLIMSRAGKRFSWGAQQDLYTITPARKQYISALKLADQGHYADLLKFARS